ncbi:hypothetical protein A2U01_0027105, partial [Trifolium medium]|nr:hypothetical protein [Trifolium medium]
MDLALEHENHELREEVTTLRAGMDRLNAMVEGLMAAQNRSPTPPSPHSTQAQVQTTVISEDVTIPTSVPPVSVSQCQMPDGFPWGMPSNFMPEGCQPAVQHVMTVPPPVVHTVPFGNEQIYHAEPSECLGVEGRMEDFQNQFQEMKREIKALRGKDLFGKNASDLCLVPNIKLPPKFKVPDFEKYKGDSCPRSHLTMYARKMSTQTDNHQVLIHYFQDSLTGAALK